ncbi:MAG TPA: FCD domain-containing protein [Devosiaceae bacterium]|jgi:DNA-binding FadR family transcriptional regulator
MIEELPPFGEFSRRSCFEFRMGIEGEAAAAAARNRTAADLADIALRIERLEQVRERSELGLDEDFAFHLSVARASQNHYFVSVLNSLKGTIYEGMLLARAATGLNVSEKLTAINDQHTLVYKAIVSGDENRARLMMRSHLLRCKKSTAHWDVFSEGV